MSADFWQDVRNRVSADNCDFHGMRFPSDPGGKAFEGMQFRVAANFRNAEFDDNINFEHVTFHEDVDFSGAKFRLSAFFAGSTFRRYCYFDGAEVSGYASFIGACFESEARFQSTVFCKDAFFDGARFKLGAGFWESEFRESASFAQAVFEMWLSIATARVNGTMTFSLPWQNPPPFRYLAAGEDAYRLAKRASERSGDYRMAGEYHYAEQCAIGAKKREDARELWHDKWYQGIAPLVRSYGELYIGQWLFGYGERLLRPLLVGGVLILLWAILYSMGGIVNTADNGDSQISHNLWDSLYLSIVTFTTLGYGDLLPSSGLMRALACVEALAGSALMSLFIVSLARRFTR